MFSDFWHKLSVAYGLKIDLIKLFSEKFCFEVFVSKRLKKGLKWGVSGIIKNQYMEFFRFLDEVTVMQKLIIYLKIMVLGKHCFELCRTNMWPKMVRKWDFSSCVKNQCTELSWFFAWCYSSMKTYNWVLTDLQYIFMCIIFIYVYNIYLGKRPRLRLF